MTHVHMNPDGHLIPRRSILLVGGGGGGSTGPPPDGAPLPQQVRDTVTTPGGLKQVLSAMIQEAGEMGFDVRVMQLSDVDDGGGAWDAWVKDVGDTLASQEWDGFIIGNGIRGTPRLTIVFERLVNIGREVAPKARMGFNTHPLDVVDTIRRMFEV